MPRQAPASNHRPNDCSKRDFHASCVKITRERFQIRAKAALQSFEVTYNRDGLGRPRHEVHDEPTAKWPGYR
jgi:hypothetical protein